MKNRLSLETVIPFAAAATIAVTASALTAYYLSASPHQSSKNHAQPDASSDDTEASNDADREPVRQSDSLSEKPGNQSQASSSIRHVFCSEQPGSSTNSPRAVQEQSEALSIPSHRAPQNRPSARVADIVPPSNAASGAPSTHTANVAAVNPPRNIIGSNASQHPSYSADAGTPIPSALRPPLRPSPANDHTSRPLRWTHSDPTMAYPTPLPASSAIPSNPALLSTRSDMSAQTAHNTSFAWFVYWDLENIMVPKGVSVASFVQALRHELATHRGQENPDPVARIIAMANTTRMASTLVSQLHILGVTMVHVETGGRKDAADKALLTDLCMLPLYVPPRMGIALLSGDVDFAHAISRLTALSYYTMVIARDSSCSAFLPMAPTSIMPLSQIVLTAKQIPKPKFTPSRTNSGQPGSSGGRSNPGPQRRKGQGPTGQRPRGQNRKNNANNNGRPSPADPEVRVNPTQPISNLENISQSRPVAASTKEKSKNCVELAFERLAGRNGWRRPTLSMASLVLICILVLSVVHMLWG